MVGTEPIGGLIEVRSSKNTWEECEQPKEIDTAISGKWNRPRNLRLELQQIQILHILIRS